MLWTIIVLAIAVLAVPILRWRRAARAERTERGLLRFHAQIWGVDAANCQSLEQLREEVSRARSAGSCNDPLQTAARAMRAQQERERMRS